MKKELIKTTGYLLVVDDSEIKVGDWVIETRNGLNELHFTNSRYVINKHIQKKVIAHLPLNDSPILEGVPLLPPLEDDVEKLAEDLFDKGSDNLLHPQYQMRTFFNIGYNKAREKYKFTEEDMIIIRNQLVTILPTGDISAWWDMIQSISKYTKWLDEYVESLSQPKMPTHFECKTFDTGNDELDGTHILEIRTTTNSQGQEVVCGKYIY